MSSSSSDEVDCLQALRALDVLDSEDDDEFAGLVEAAALACGTLTALITLVDEDRRRSDHHGCRCGCNLDDPIMEGLTGWTSIEATGCSLNQVFHVLNEGTRLPVASPVDDSLKLDYSTAPPTSGK